MYRNEAKSNLSQSRMTQQKKKKPFLIKRDKGLGLACF